MKYYGDARVWLTTPPNICWWFCWQIYFRSLLVIDIMVAFGTFIVMMVFVIAFFVILVTPGRDFHWWAWPFIILWFSVLSIIIRPLFLWRKKWYSTRIESWEECKYRERSSWE